MLNKPITIFGDGKQVRDLLFVEDLLDAYDSAVSHIDKAAGQVYNLGSGSENAVSIWAEFGPMLENMCGHEISVKFEGWRLGDQKVCIYDLSKIKRVLNWAPKIDIVNGTGLLYDWVKENVRLFRG